MVFISKKRQIHNNQENLIYLKNYSIIGIIFWQSKVIRECVFSDFDKVIFLGEMNILSTWISCLICKLRKKKFSFGLILWK